MRLSSIALSVAFLAPAVADAATPISLGNAGFESQWTGTPPSGSNGTETFYYAPADVTWSFVGGAGVAESTRVGALYEGSRFAFLQADAGVLTQSFSLGFDSAVTLSFAVARRLGYNSGQVVGVLIDGIQVDSVEPVDVTWQVATFNLASVGAGSHTLSFAGLTGGDTTAYIDAVELSAAPVPEPASVSLMLAGLGALALRRRSTRT